MSVHCDENGINRPRSAGGDVWVTGRGFGLFGFICKNGLHLASEKHSKRWNTMGACLCTFSLHLSWVTKSSATDMGRTGFSLVCATLG